VRPSAALQAVLTLSLGASLGLLAGCKVSVKAGQTARPVEESAPPPPSKESKPPVRSAFIGVTHALTLTPEAAAIPRCRCLAATVGAGDDPAFVWRSTPPVVGDEALVVGISNEGTPCERPVGGRGPSIAGVEQHGGNVIVHIEEGRPGAPLARGAIFVRPPGDGSYLIFRAQRRLPYGEPLPGANSDLCRIPLGPTSPSAPAR
jgi:hypothetical protein